MWVLIFFDIAVELGEGASVIGHCPLPLAALVLLAEFVKKLVQESEADTWRVLLVGEYYSADAIRRHIYMAVVLLMLDALAGARLRLGNECAAKEHGHLSHSVSVEIPK